MAALGLFGITASDEDGGGGADALSYALTNLPASGVLTGAAPDLNYAPNANFNGIDEFDFTVDDGDGGSDTATVTILVGNQEPMAFAAAVTTSADAPIAITLQASDLDGDVLSYSVVSGPSSGTLSGVAPDLTYTPNANFFGTDTFTYRTNDGRDFSEPATVTIDIHSLNDAPQAASRYA